MTVDQKDSCHVIIHAAAASAGAVGAGLAQLPMADNVVIVPIQIAMITALGKVFGKSIANSAAKGILASAGATVAGRSVSQLLIGWIPIIGNASNAATAAAITEAIGWAAAEGFDKEIF